MDSLDELKTIWQTAGIAQLLDAAEFVQLVKKFRRRKLRGMAGIIAAAIAAIGLMVMAMFGYKSILLSTRLGELLITAALLMLIAATMKSIKRFRNLQDDCSNKEMLSFMEVTRQNQLRYYRYNQVFIMGVWACGFLLYIYEMVYKHTTWLVGAYGICVVYILILLFVIRPYSYKREAKKLHATKEHMERILNQLP